MDVIGKLYKKGEVQSRGANGFQFREFIIEVPNPQNPQWNNYIPFQASGNALTLVDQFNIGEELVVTFDIRGRMWTNPQGEERCIMNLSAWRIQKYDPSVVMQQPNMGNSYPQQNGFQQPMGGYQQPAPGYQQPMGGFQQPAPMHAQPSSQPVGAPGNDASGLPF